MKKFIKKTALTFGILALGFTACKKENCSPTQFTENNNSESEIEALSLQSDLETQNIEVIYDENEYQVAAINEGIAIEYLVDESDINETSYSASSSSSSRTHIRDHSFIRCLKSVKPDSNQIRKLRATLNAFDKCKMSATERARAIHRSLQLKYQKLAKEQARLLADGKITRSEYKARIERLRAAFSKELRELQLRAKLHEAFRDCHKKMLRELNGILSDRQWRAFIACYKK